MSAKILVADESPTIHKIVAMAFEEEGITVEGISRGEHVLEYMVEFQPDIVLADIHLPGTDGYQLCREIKDNSSFGSVRVVLLTSDFEDINQEELKVSGADDFISKPFKTEEILKKVKSQLEKPAPEKEVRAKKIESPQEPESNEVIQNEFEDIINQSKESTNQSEESTTDTVKQLFPEDDEFKPSIDEIDLETDAPSEPKTREPQKEKPRPAKKTREHKITPNILLDLPEETFHAETRPVKINTGDLNSVFLSVLSSPRPGPENTPKREPGSKPNLIEETLSFMGNQQTEERVPEITLTPEAEAKKEPVIIGTSTDSSLADRIFDEHMDHITNQIQEDARHETPASFEETVRAVLGEMAPKIIRQVIQEEIESIKKTKEA
jgi:DNA-binding response OmpR family regulator